MKKMLRATTVVIILSLIIAPAAMGAPIERAEAQIRLGGAEKLTYVGQTGNIGMEVAAFPSMLFRLLDDSPRNDYILIEKSDILLQDLLALELTINGLSPEDEYEILESESETITGYTFTERLEILKQKLEWIGELLPGSGITIESLREIVVTRIDESVEIVSRLIVALNPLNVDCFSSNFPNGFWIQFLVEDPYHDAETINVTGPGIDGSLSLTYGAYRPGEWWSVPNLYLGQSHPQPPLIYTFRILSHGVTYFVDDTIYGFIDEFATPLTPSGTASGDITFTWVGIGIPDTKYQIQLADQYWNGLWDSEIIDGNSVAYSGPPLTPGENYQYFVVSIDAYGNASFAHEQFIYE